MRIIVPYGRGGGSDRLARAMAIAITANASTNASKTVSVLNRPAHAGVSAALIYSQLTADGKTLLQATDNLVANTAGGHIPREVLRSLKPLAIVQQAFNQIYIRPGDQRFTNWQQVVQYSKENPAPLTIAVVGNPFTMEPILVHQLEQALSITLKIQSYDQPKVRYQALTEGEVDLLIEQPGDVLTLLERSEIKPILTLLKQRSPSFPQVPALTESGLAFDPMFRFRGYFIASDTPGSKISELQKTLKQAWDSKEFQAFNHQQMIKKNSYLSGDNARAFIQQQYGIYQRFAGQQTQPVR